MGCDVTRRTRRRPPSAGCVAAAARRHLFLDAGAARGPLQLDAGDRQLLLQFDDLAQGEVELVLRDQQRRQVDFAGFVQRRRALSNCWPCRGRSWSGRSPAPPRVAVRRVRGPDVLDDLQLRLGQLVRGGDLFRPNLFPRRLPEVEDGKRDGERRPDPPLRVVLPVDADLAALQRRNRRAAVPRRPAPAVPTPAIGFRDGSPGPRRSRPTRAPGKRPAAATRRQSPFDVANASDPSSRPSVSRSSSRAASRSRTSPGRPASTGRPT